MIISLDEEEVRRAIKQYLERLYKDATEINFEQTIFPVIEEIEIITDVVVKEDSETIFDSWKDVADLIKKTPPPIIVPDITRPFDPMRDGVVLYGMAPDPNIPWGTGKTITTDSIEFTGKTDE